MRLHKRVYNIDCKNNEEMTIIKKTEIQPQHGFTNLSKFNHNMDFICNVYCTQQSMSKLLLKFYKIYKIVHHAGLLGALHKFLKTM